MIKKKKNPRIVIECSFLYALKDERLNNFRMLKIQVASLDQQVY